MLSFPLLLCPLLLRCPPSLCRLLTISPLCCCHTKLVDAVVRNVNLRHSSVHRRLGLSLDGRHARGCIDALLSEHLLLSSKYCWCGLKQIHGTHKGFDED